MKREDISLIVDPNETDLYFDKEVLGWIQEDVGKQLDGIETNPGESYIKLIFCSESQWTNSGEMNIAATAFKEFKKLESKVNFLRYYLYQGEKLNFDTIPNEIINDFRQLSSQLSIYEDPLPLIDNEPVAELEIELVFHLLRSQLPIEEYSLILYLLILQRDGFLDEIDLKENGIAKLINGRVSIALQSKDNEDLFLFTIYDYFSSSLNNAGDDVLRIIIDAFRRIWDYLKNDFSSAFDHALYKLVKSEGRGGGEYLQPIELTRFVLKLSGISIGEKVYNPFSGLASFGVILDDGQQYFGQEIALKTWVISALRVIAYNREFKVSISHGDSIKQWNPRSEKYDLIVANPPFGAKLNHKVEGKFGTIRTFTQFLFEKGIPDLNPKGRLIGVIPFGFLFSSTDSDKNIRKYLVDSDLLDTVVLFPGGVLKNTNLIIVVVMINLNKKLKGQVRFIDASKYVEVNALKEKRINDHALNEIIDKYSDNDSIRIVTNDQIVGFDYNLVPSRYFQKEFQGIELGGIVSRIKGSRQGLPKLGKFVRIRDLKDDRLNSLLNYHDVQESELPMRAVQISESVLLLATRWKSLKPTYFNFEGRPIYIIPDTIALKVDKNKVDIDWLINELHSVYVIEQLRILRVGETIPMIRSSDLLSIKIQVPPIEEQRAKIQGAKEALIEIKKSQLEKEATKYGLDKRIFSEFASLKHTLGSPLQNILSNNNVMLSFLENEKSEHVKAVKELFITSFDENMPDLLRSIKSDITYISELLERGEKGLVLHDYDMEISSLPEVEEVFSNLMGPRFNFGIKLNPVNVQGRDDLGIKSNTTLMKAMIMNILDNASKHGFDEKKPENEVLFDLSVLDDQFILEIKNNGRPFPKGYDKQRYMEKFNTSDPKKGSGMGGYDVNRIAEHFGAKWDLVLNVDNIYPVKFHFEFPLFPIT